MFCSKCGTAVPEGASFCSACGQPMGGPQPIAASPPAFAPPPPAPIPSPQATVGQPAAVPQPQRAYAGFWLRFVAAVIDGFILLIPMGILFVVMGLGAIITGGVSSREGNVSSAAATLFGMAFLGYLALTVVGSWLYFAVMESSSWQGTLGKKALGLYVTDLTGDRATFARTSARFLSGRFIASVIPLLGVLYFVVDCVFAGLTTSKQALHDMIAGCLVLRKQ